MSEVKRYRLLDESGDGDLWMVGPDDCIVDEGPWVKASDLDRVTAERDAALGRESALTFACNSALLEVTLIKESLTYRGSLLCQLEQRADVLMQVLLAPEYLLPGAYLSEGDKTQWFRWNGEHRPINKYHLCDVVLRDGRILFNQSPYDFDWSYGAEVLAARERGERGDE